MLVKHMKLTLLTSKVVIIDAAHKKKYILSGPITEVRVQKFIEAFQAQKAGKYESGLQDEFV